MKKMKVTSNGDKKKNPKMYFFSFLVYVCVACFRTHTSAFIFRSDKFIFSNCFIVFVPSLSPEGFFNEHVQ